MTLYLWRQEAIMQSQISESAFEVAAGVALLVAVAVFTALLHRLMLAATPFFEAARSSVSFF
jgi:hypothetical protein